MLVMIDEAATTQRLAVCAGIFAIASALLGVGDMNFEHMAEVQWTYWNPAEVAVMACSCSLVFWRFPWAGWV